MPDVSGASRPDRAAATSFGCAVAGFGMIVLFVSAQRPLCTALALAALEDVDHAPADRLDKAANCQGGMIAARSNSLCGIVIVLASVLAGCQRGPCIDQRLLTSQGSRHGT